MSISNLVKCCLDNGGAIKPLIIDSQLTNGTGLMNPSIYVDNDHIKINIRHVNYTLFHSEGKQFHHFWGPLQYIHPENDCTLKTVNYFGELDDDLNIINIQKVNTSELDQDPLWEFVGLEDARIVRWDNKLYISGVRRDTTTNGQGRMELSEIEVTDNSVKEISRVRIPAPEENISYCEKNWMPIVNLPFHYIKWSNPTEVVKVNPVEKSCVTIHLETQKYIEGLCDFRGGSQVILWNGYYLAIIHEVRLFNSELGRKDGRYYHRFVVWDQNFDIVTFSDLFDFLGGDIEFCCGLALHKNNFLVTFGFQDNAAFVLKFPESLMFDLVKLPINTEQTVLLSNQVDFEENWFTYPNLYSEMVDKFPSGSRFVEVGSWKGRSSFYMCEAIIKSKKDIEFFCVDTWEGSEEHIGNYDLTNLYDKFLTNMKSVESYSFPLKLNSISASKRFKDKSLEFVFIDAAHDYESVKRDILTWLPKIKPGGVLAGHDYYPNSTEFQGVYQAVHEIFSNIPIKHFEDCFIVDIIDILQTEYINACNVPSDMNEHLPFLYDLACECSSITEFGVRHGISTRAFLYSKTPLRSYDLFLDDIVNELFLYSEQQGNDVKYIQANTLTIDIDQTDLLFIDTLHTYNQLKQELKLHSSKVNKYLVFHDTIAFGPIGENGEIGLSQAIDEFLNENPHWELQHEFTNNNGLTVLKRNDNK